MFTSFATAMLLAAKLEFVAPDANFSLRDGLPAVQVLSLYQDSYGALWAGTAGGLAQLGGRTIKTFGSDQGLSRAAISAIDEDASGALVVGTARGMFRLAGERFEPVTLPGAAATAGIRRFARAPDNTLWALAGERILLRQFADAWQVVGVNDALAFEATDLAVDSSGALWLATRNHGLLRLTAAGTRLRRSAQFQAGRDPVAPVDHVAVASGKVYFTSSRGLSILTVAGGGVVDTIPFPDGVSSGPRSVAISSSGQVFVGTSAGVLTLSGRRLVAVESRGDRARAAAVTLLSDREGQLWMGTAEAGLHVLLLGRGVRFLRGDGESFRSIHVDRSGLHWVSTERRVVTFRTDQAGRPVSVAEARFEGFDALTIRGIAEQRGDLHFAMGGGVGVLPASARASGSLRVRPDPRFEVLRDRLVTAIHEDPSGSLWAISALGAYRVPPRGAQSAESVAVPGGNPGLAVMDRDGSLWVSTRQGTLAVIDTSSARATPVALPGGRLVQFLGPSPDGGVVVTFEDGGSAFARRAGPTGEVVISDGPESPAWLSALSLQKIGESYLAAHEGDRLSQVRLRPWRVEQTILTSADLEEADFRNLALGEGRAGQMWFTLLSGIGRLDPPNAPPPPTRLRVRPRLSAYELEPRPNQLDLQVELADPVAPRKPRYRHRLLGATEEWSRWSDDPHIPLANIPPGAYQLEVEAEDRYGRRGDAVVVDIVAAGHLWEHWPFRAALALVATGALWGLYVGRVRSLDRDRRELERAVKAGRADLEAANQRLQELSLTDVLTGLRNRRYFSEVVEDEIRLLKRRFDERSASGDPNRDAVFFLLDLDHFKTVNDLFGHAGGDAVLKETARRLESLLRRTDRLVRWGGEEFLVLSLDCQRKQAPEMAARMMAAISQEAYPVGPAGGIHITTSIGWASYPFPGQESEPHPEDVVRLADRGLYRAKRAGRNCAVGILPVGDESFPGGSMTGTVELFKDLGITVSFVLVRGEPTATGRDVASIRDSGPFRRPS
jgi:diguanylate cyclase (GGDEF)-like protein